MHIKCIYCPESTRTTATTRTKQTLLTHAGPTGVLRSEGPEKPVDHSCRLSCVYTCLRGVFGGCVCVISSGICERPPAAIKKWLTFDSAKRRFVTDYIKHWPNHVHSLVTKSLDGRFGWFSVLSGGKSGFAMFGKVCVGVFLNLCFVLMLKSSEY